MHPSEYHPDLTDHRLQFIAEKIMEQVELTYETNSSPYDDSWTLGCTIFGRAKVRLSALGKDSTVNWFETVKEGMDYVGRIGEVPFSFRY